MNAIVIPLPILLTEKEAAARLGISVASVQRLRRSGEIAFVKIGRLIKYKESQLADYVEGATCREESASGRSENTGCRAGRIRKSGSAPGSTPILDRRAAKALALETLKKPKSRSQNGSSKTRSGRAKAQSN